LGNNPKVKQKQETLLRLKNILCPYGDNIYSDYTFDDATANLVNLHSNLEETHYITSKHPTYGTDVSKEIMKRKSLIVSNPQKFVDIISYSEPKFIEWYESLELLKLQQMDGDAKKATVESMTKPIENR